MLKRLFDVLSVFLLIIILLPFFLFLSLLILLTSSGGVFYKQERIGKHGVSFKLFKFRTMKIGSDRKGLITIGNRDSRITKVGYYLRKYKLDEFPQLINILKNEMSVVGPRPEVAKYIDMYSLEQRKVLRVKPGLTDLASLAYINENEILGEAENPEEVYVNEIMPEKLRLNLIYLQKQSFSFDLAIIFKTIIKVLNK